MNLTGFSHRHVFRGSFSVAAALAGWLLGVGVVAGEAWGRQELGPPPEPPTAEAVERMKAEAARPRVRSAARPYEIDTANREQVRNFYNSVYLVSEGAGMAWTGNGNACLAGTTAVTFRDEVARRINFFRAMAGVPAVITFNEAWNLKAQQAALMMSRNDDLNHTPPASWSCFSEDGFEAAGQSNLALGQGGPQAITAYIEDYGAGNASVGHRRWVLYPQTQTMGTGDVPREREFSAANANWVFDEKFGSSRPATRTEFVAWPPAGHVPYQLVFPRWSFSLPDADFTKATVTVTRQGVALPVTLEKPTVGAGENSLVWHEASLDPTNQYRAPPPPPPPPDTV